MFQERELSTVEAELPDGEEEVEQAAVLPGNGQEAPLSAVPPVAESAAASEEQVDEIFTPGAAVAAGKLQDGSSSKDLVAEADAVIAAAKAKGASATVLEKLDGYRSKVVEDVENVPDASEQAVFDEYSKEQGELDLVFTRFRRYTAANDTHVLRYAAGKPLWFCTRGRLDGDAPSCPCCGSARVFEFQVQPQLIALLMGTPLADRLDYGVICCYTCRNSCDPPASSPYLEEFAYVQPEPVDGWLPKG
jgi:hypothetical protein